MADAEFDAELERELSAAKQAAMAGADRHVPKVAITAFEDRDGVTWYTIETSFGNGPIVRVRKRYSEFEMLHSAVDPSTAFPVAKQIVHTDDVKEMRRVELSAYLAQACDACVKRWAVAAKSAGSIEAAGDVLSPELQVFLGVAGIDRERRLDPAAGVGRSMV